MAVTEYTWDPLTDSVLEETDGAGNVRVTYTNAPMRWGPLLGESRAGQSIQYCFDALGSTRVMTDENGDVTDTFAYDAWGNEIYRAGTSDTPYRWVARTGYQHTSLASDVCVRQRFYSIHSGRWTSLDILYTPRSANRYDYGRNAPTTVIDPSGMIPVDPDFCDVNPNLRDAIPMISPPQLLWGYLEFYDLYFDPRRLVYAGFWEVVDLNERAAYLLDMLKTASSVRDAQAAVESQLSQNATPTCKKRTFKDCGTFSGIRGDTTNVTTQLVLGRFTLHWAAKCTVDPWRKGAATCLSSYRCTIKWLVYDEYDFPWFINIPMFWNNAGKDYLITGTWSTPAGGLKTKLLPPDGCCCPPK